MNEQQPRHLARTAGSQPGRPLGGPEAVVFKGHLFILKEYIKFLIDPAAPNQPERLPQTKAIKSFKTGAQFLISTEHVCEGMFECIRVVGGGEGGSCDCVLEE